MGNLIVILLIGAYVWGFWKFQTGFENTNFDRALPNRVVLGLLWPGLLIFNKSYRKNFQKALRGR